MKKLLLTIVISAWCASVNSAPKATDFDKAVTRYAQSSARDLMASLISQHASGTSWKIILSQNLPKMIDDRCGYREKLNLPEDGFTQMRDAVSVAAGVRFDSAFSDLLSRPSAKLALVTVKKITYSGSDQALVTMKVLPARQGDTNISLLYQLDDGGRMSLCDLAPGDTVDKGILLNISNELKR